MAKRIRRRRRIHADREAVGIIVEGETEFHAIPTLYKDTLIRGVPPIKATNLGGVGSDRKPRGIAELVKNRVRSHWEAGRSRVIICIDREQRTDCVVSLGAAIRSELDRLLPSIPAGCRYDIVIADRAFEAWILADAFGLYIKRKFVKRPSFHCFEGESGSEGRKGVAELSVLLGREYRKTTDGPRLFAALDFAAARKCKAGQRGSRSLDRLLRKLGV